jgi:hypothetical protein
MTDRRKVLVAIDALGSILRQEIVAIESGNFAQVVTFSSEKARLSALLEKQLQDDPQSVSKEVLQGLKDLIVRDSQHLQQAQLVTAEIIQEVSNTRKRHSAAGLYGPSGAKRDNSAIGSILFDKSF